MPQIPESLQKYPQMVKFLQWMNKIGKLTDKLVEDLIVFVEVGNAGYQLPHSFGQRYELEIDHEKPEIIRSRIIENYQEDEIYYLGKQVIPQYLPSCEILIQTVGFSTQPLLLSVAILKPRYVILLHTEDSIGQAEEVENHHIIENRKITIYKIEIDPTDVIDIYNKFETVLTETIGEDYSTLDIVIDPTAGKKSMVTGLSAAALYFDMPIVYLDSIQIGRRVLPFSENIKQIVNPYSHFGHQKLQFLLELFNSHALVPVQQEAKKFRELTMDRMARDYADRIEFLAAIYYEWDTFVHSKPDQNVLLSKRLAGLLATIEDRFSSEILETIGGNIDHLMKIEDHWIQGSTDMCDYFRIIDLIQNARRRKEQQRYDDGLARLFRVTEMLANHILKDIQEQTVDDVEKAKGVEFGLDIDMTETVNKLSLFSKMKIISKVRKDLIRVYKEYVNDEVFKTTRNVSIIAHGTVTVNQEEYDHVERILIHWCKLIFNSANFEEDFARAKFPRFETSNKLILKLK